MLTGRSGDYLSGKVGNYYPKPQKVIRFLKENFSAQDVTLSAGAFERLDQIINQATVAGPRYNANTQLEIDTEEFAV